MQASTGNPLGRDFKSRPIRLCILSLILVALIAGAAASGTISKVSVTNKPDSVIIQVQGTAPLKMTPLIASRYLGFQFAGRMTAKGGLVGIRGGGIYCVRYSRYCERPPLARVVLNTWAALDYSTDWNSDRSQVTITVVKFGTKPQAAVGSKDEPRRMEPGRMDKAEQPKVVAASAVDMPVLPPAEIAGPQGSDPGTPAETPTSSGTVMASAASVSEHLASAKSSPEPMRVARLASSVPVDVAQAVAVPTGPIEKKVSLNFLGADINDVLKALAAQTGANIVASKDVKGEITVSLTDVSLEQALDYVAKLSGFSYSKLDGTYLVAPKDSLKVVSGDTGPVASTEIVPVSFSNCDDLLNLVKSRYPDVQAAKVGASGGKSGSETGGGSIVLSGPAASLAQAKLLVEQVDAPGGTDQFVYQVKYVAPDKLADTLRKLLPNVLVEGLGITAKQSGAGGGAGGGASGGGGDSGGGGGESAGGVGADINVVRMSGLDQMTQFKQQTPMNAASLDSLSRTIVVTGSKDAVARAKALVEALDVKAAMIKIDARVTSITETGEKKIGLTWSWGDLQVLEDIAAPTQKNVEGYTTAVSVSPNTTVDRALGRWFRQPVSFGATLDALITDGNGKLLASPNLLCLEGKPAQFFVGDQIRYVVLVQQTPQGNNVQTDQANVGIQLTVVGNVSPDGYITLNLHPEVSVVQLSEDKQAGITLPTITRRYTDHVVRVKNGQTIAIGGLISDDDLVTLKKIPLLGDLPFLGQLFRHKDRSKDHSEVVIFITASVVND